LVADLWVGLDNLIAAMKLSTFTHQVALDAPVLPTVLTPLLHHYRAGLQPSLFANRMTLTMDVAYEGDANAAWALVPKDGEPFHLRAAAKLSVQLQRALRAWLMFSWCANSENLSDTARTTAILAYAASRPFTPKTKMSYGYDLLEDAAVAGLHRSIRMDIAEPLASVQAQLRILGHHNLADYYSPVHAEWFSQEARRGRKVLYDILAREARIVEAWIPLMGHPLQALRFENAMNETRIALRQLLGREGDYSYLAPALAIEASAAMDLASDREVPRRLLLSGNPEKNVPAGALPLYAAPAPALQFPVPYDAHRRGGKVLQFPAAKPGADAKADAKPAAPGFGGRLRKAA
jgi:hypothetical protein